MTKLSNFPVVRKSTLMSLFDIGQETKPPQPQFAQLGYLQFAGIFLFFGLGLILNSVNFLPTYSPEGGISYDELAYIGSGKDLIEHGTLRVLSLGPMISFIYGVIYIGANIANNWVLFASVAGRITAYALMFLGVWLIGRELQYRRLSHPLIMVGLLTALPVYFISLTNPNYILFMAFAGLAFWRAMTFLRRRNPLALLQASGLLGCAIMVRPDPVLTLTFVAITCLTSRSKGDLIKICILALGPVSLIVGFYILIYRLRTGVFDTGMSSRLYLMFETSYQLLQHTTGQEITATSESALIAARRAFGTPDENHQSVVLAIYRNPLEFAKMVWANTTQMTIPYLYFSFGVRQPLIGFVVGLFAARGAAELIIRKCWILLAFFFLWFFHLGIYLLTMSFPSFLIFDFYEVFALAAIGIFASLTNLHRGREKVVWVCGIGATLWLGLGSAWKGYIVSLSENLAGYPILADTGRPAIIVGFIGSVLLVVATILPRQRESVIRLSWVGILVTALALEWPSEFRFNWPGPQTGYERQAEFLREHFAKNDRVLAYAGFAPIMAKMTWVPITIDMRSFNTSQAVLETYLSTNNIAAVGIDSLFTDSDPWRVWSAIRSNGDHILDPIYASDDGKFFVLRPHK